MPTESIFTLLARTQPPGTSILCFDREQRVTFLSAEAEKLCLHLFGSALTEAQVLPRKMQALVTSLDRGAATLPIPDGASVRLRLVLDPQKRNHCLLFEQEIAISSPDQLKPRGLTTREAEISYWIYQRKTNWEIGRILELSPRTVEKHIENVFRKLDVNNRENLVAKLRQSDGSGGVSVTPR
jgi:DNA-binding CsgD family transcriptional regulator